MAEHSIKRDIIAAVSGPGWSYGLARLVFDTQDRVAVFVPPGDSPVQEFTFTKGNDMAGTGTVGDSQVTYRRRAASCGWRLAYCNMKTPTLMARWNAVPVPADG